MKAKKPQKNAATHLAGRPKDAAKRDGIARAANALFLKNGYELTSMEAVAKKAGVSKLTIYSHFSKKEELFKEVIRQRCGKLAMPESYMALTQGPVEKSLLTLGINYTALIFRPDSIQLHRIIQAEAERHPKVVQIFFEAGPKRVREAFGHLLETWNAQKQLAVPDIAKATDQFFSLLKGETLMKVMLLRTPIPSEAELKMHVKATVDVFLAAYRPKSKSGNIL